MKEKEVNWRKKIRKSSQQRVQWQWSVQDPDFCRLFQFNSIILCNFILFTYNLIRFLLTNTIQEDWIVCNSSYCNHLISVIALYNFACIFALEGKNHFIVPQGNNEICCICIEAVVNREVSSSLSYSSSIIWNWIYWRRLRK